MSAEVQEKWLKWVALTTTILAVCTAFGSLKGGGYSTQVQLMTTQVNDQWSYYQAQKVKLHINEMEKDILSIELIKDNSALVKDAVGKKIALLESNIKKYNKDKDDIKTSIDDLAAKQVNLKRHGSNFGLAVMFFQIAIMLSAIGSLLKQKPAWLFGLALGLIGFVYFLNGFFLFF